MRICRDGAQCADQCCGLNQQLGLNQNLCAEAPLCVVFPSCSVCSRARNLDVCKNIFALRKSFLCSSIKHWAKIFNVHYLQQNASFSRTIYRETKLNWIAHGRGRKNVWSMLVSTRYATTPTRTPRPRGISGRCGSRRCTIHALGANTEPAVISPVTSPQKIAGLSSTCGRTDQCRIEAARRQFVQRIRRARDRSQGQWDR